jgi:hypothetical protein
MSWKSFHGVTAAPSRGSAIHHGNRQDAREGGETPPLPRNCERPCFVPARRIGPGAGNQPGFSATAEAPGNHWRRAPGSFLGRWLERRKSGDRSSAPLTRLRSEGNEGAIMPVSASFFCAPFERALRACCRHRHFLLLRCAAHSARLPPSAAWSRTPPAPRSPAPTWFCSATARWFHRRLHGRRQLSDSHRGRGPLLSWWSPPRASASWRRRAFTPAGSIRSSATCA